MQNKITLGSGQIAKGAVFHKPGVGTAEPTLVITDYGQKEVRIALNEEEAKSLRYAIDQCFGESAKCVEPQGSLEDRVVGLGKSVVEARNLVKRLVSEATSAKDYAKLVRGQHGQAFLKNFYTDHAFERLLASLNISLHHLDEVLGDGK